MKKLTIAISSILLSTAVFAADAPTTTASSAKAESNGLDMSKVSYLIGRGVGEQLSKGKITIDQANFDKGLQSALAGQKSEIPEAKAQQIMQAFQKEMMEKMQKAQIEAATNNLKLANDFQQAIAKVDGIKEVDGSKGVYIQVLKQGDGAQPTKSDSVTVNYRGTTPTQAYADDKEAAIKTIQEGNLIGDQFDSSYDRGTPATFPLSGVVKCWQDAIPQMKVGEKAIVYCAPDTAYGTSGNAAIGPNQLLSFQVELLKVNS
ncbi:peptidyl-prolyl cis-trans isomerase Mip [Francisella philomiragia subsp. philomiragia ATCC 25015]|uniref:FKBP-type peptidyl-prolyl cis-trans isomerase n=1 Tax=Francisella philomiragia TaxID=28110 RepID=UPI0001AF7B47|nr:FKBP-type peptidyl-prolyl cis-trans isomerase [Francisella philomiragia]AJI74157.1 peptidyl-prolyl cis-trans isomerase Mip [Francisella philomiragia subsp. philomiragia ATCC 25015]MBK2237660.1 FKBP-type peptidyl-prolyl cis-trans isomerase [Francisella philomiragia]